MVDNLADLRAKLKAREGRPGYESNVAELKRIIKEAEGNGYIYRKTQSYHFVSEEYAKRNPSTTFKTKVER